jgi:adenylate kinase
VALAGLSGVGKSTLLTRLKSVVQMQILQASALIKEARTSTEGGALTLDKLRAANLDENQRLLIQGFARRVDPAAHLVLLDCHTVIETPGELIRIDPHVFAAMEVTAMVFLEDEPEAIVRRRKNDATRQRPAATAQELGLVQTEAMRHARAIVEALSIPLYVHHPTREDDAITERLHASPGGV